MRITRRLATLTYSILLLLTACYSEENKTDSSRTVSRDHDGNNSSERNEQEIESRNPPFLFFEEDVVVVKVGGSSITDKARKETLQDHAIRWFARTVTEQASDYFRRGDGPDSSQSSCRSSNDEVNRIFTRTKVQASAFILVHGAGSFGHHTAKEYGLTGYLNRHSNSPCDPPSHSENQTTAEQQRTRRGLAETRRSVQQLNQVIVQALLDQGLNTVAISPCFGVIPMLPIPCRDEKNDTARASKLDSVTAAVQDLILSTLRAGLIPVLHGDACLVQGSDGDASILSGDTLVEMIGSASYVSRIIFLTDVDGVYTRDPNSDPSARLLPQIKVTKSGEIIVSLSDQLEASGSTHDHDVTGGLKTKLASASFLASIGKNVTIARCGSKSAELAIGRHEDGADNRTMLYLSTSR